MRGLVATLFFLGQPLCGEEPVVVVAAPPPPAQLQSEASEGDVCDPALRGPSQLEVLLENTQLASSTVVDAQVLVDGRPLQQEPPLSQGVCRWWASTQALEPGAHRVNAKVHYRRGSRIVTRSAGTNRLAMTFVPAGDVALERTLLVTTQPGERLRVVGHIDLVAGSPPDRLVLEASAARRD